jgi:hypothetical protein
MAWCSEAQGQLLTLPLLQAGRSIGNEEKINELETDSIKLSGTYTET